MPSNDQKGHKNQRPVIGRQVSILATEVIFAEPVRNITRGHEKREISGNTGWLPDVLCFQVKVKSLE